MTADSPTPAELRALRAYIEAGSARGAAVELRCSEQTVKNHLGSIRVKLGVHRIAQAVFLLKETLAA